MVDKQVSTENVLAGRRAGSHSLTDCALPLPLRAHAAGESDPGLLPIFKKFAIQGLFLESHQAFGLIQKG